MKQVAESVTLPTAGSQTTPGPVFRSWAAYLTPLFRDIGFRLNRCLPHDGSERMTNPLPLAVYTTATRPAAADWPGCVILVSDAVGPNKFQGSDGTSWVALG
jgi:hypothetical protein